jgi:formylglycine-generating enzyme required for sulfatase activity/tRNA A-37 threonylcarbamoyl transferase component Bud32
MNDLYARLEASLSTAYRLERELGSGGMAVVYLAHDLRHKRRVALKVLRPEVSAVIGPARFLREIETLANLTHPHILPLHDSGEVEGLLYYVMPFVEGESLRDRLQREKQLPLDDALRIMRDVTDALHHAHGRGVIHRDIKPENILLSDGHALVADFGIAAAIDVAGDSSRLTRTGFAVGTPAYMSPEQALGERTIDARADIYALGCVLYEMLAGEPPFNGPTAQVVLARRLHEPVPSLRFIRELVPEAIDQAITKALARAPADRHASAGKFAEALTQPVASATSGELATHAGGAGSTRTAWWRLDRRRAALLEGALVLIAVGAFIIVRGVGAFGGDSERWARASALPELARLIDEVNWEAAWPLVQRIEKSIPGDSMFEAARAGAATRVAITSDPPGASVYRRFYSATDTVWEFLGRTPLADIWFPNGTSQLRIELAGYQTVYRAGAPIGPPFVRKLDRVDMKLDRENAIPAEMVRIPGGPLVITNPQLEHLEAIELGDYLMDRYEVTNREYKRFLDAGGYQRREFWKHEFRRAGRLLSWEDAMRELVDRTGRVGPATWEGSAFPEGDDDLPVTGVSWYEAAAYAEFAGKALPTVYHWSHAASTGMGAEIVPRSNFSQRATRAVTASTAMGWYGTYDQGGNVREWCLNESRSNRYVMGGGWNDWHYTFNDAYTQPPWDRSVTNGIRLVRYLDQRNLAEAARPIELPHRDYLTERPVTDEVFEVFRNRFAYDRKPLNATVQATDSSHVDWVKQRVAFDAAYSGPRMLVDLYLPKRYAPPHQVVIFFPPGNALQLPSSRNVPTNQFDFMIKSGRALAYPIYRGTYERGAGEMKSDPDQTVKFREYMTMWGLDYRRTIDYLETRNDIDTTRIAYYGLSWGGAVGAILPAIEPRTKVVVLNVGGLEFQRALPEADQINYVPRIKQPTLMLNGKYDHYYPLETSQRPMFSLLGAQDKRHVISDAGHLLPRPQMIGETLGWLDRYLDTVRTVQRPR